MRNQRLVMTQMSYRFLSSLFIISLIISIVESLNQLALSFYQERIGTLTEFHATVMNIFLLVLISAPLLWFIVLRPLVVQLSREQDAIQDQTRLNAELRNALDIHALVSLSDAQGRIIYANDRFCQVSGYRLEELIGKDHRIINSNYHDSDYIGAMWQTIKQGKTWQGIFRNRRKDGSFYWVESTITPLLDDTGRPYQYISIRQDVTAQKEATAQLVTLKRAVEACSEMILITNAEGYIQYVNPSLCQQTGWTHATLMGRKPNVLDSIHTDKQTLEAIQQALLRGQGWSGRLLQRRRGKTPFYIAGQTPPPDPLEFWTELSMTPVLNRDGSLSGYVQIQRDIHEQVHREAMQQMESADTAARLAIAEKLQQTDSLKARFASALDILFGLKDLELQRKGGVFLRHDDREYLEMFLLNGEFSEEFIKREKQVPLGVCLCGRAAVFGKLLVSDDCFCDPRHERTFEGMKAHGHFIVPIGAAGKIIGVLFLYTDPYPSQNENRLTMLKQVGELMGLAVLQEQVKVSLEKARDMALQTALAKSEFLANMSHEIRTPMNGVLGMLDLLRDTDMSSDQWDLVDTAYASAEALLSILNDILDFSKLEAGKVEIEHVSFDLPELVGDVCALLVGRAYSKKLELNCFIPVDMPQHWKGDPNRIRQILTNLIGNAVKFTVKGEVSVTVKRVLDTQGQDNIRFEVRDTGVGIALEAQARLFQPFSQAESTTARRFGGTGLGLSISRNLVQLMEGAIGLESVLDEGTCFWFTLPLSVSEETQVYVPPVNGAGKRVLVVDDNATNRSILQHYLSHWGFSVGEADNGRRALIELERAISHQAAYDLILLDMHMPEMDGLALLHAINERPALRTVPRIMLSSGGLMADKERRELGVAQSLLKPVRQTQLFDAIAYALHSASQLDALKNKDAAISTSYLGKKLLVVEDNKVNQKVIVGMLAKFDLVPDIADNGQIALDKLTSVHYDLVLMDCQMPVLDGYHATQQLRVLEQKQNKPRLAVVALTAHAIAGEREKCLAAGMDDYLTKPITRDSLAQLLAHWLTGEQNAPPALTPPIATTAASVWNASAALDCLGGDSELLAGMIAVFLNEAPQQLIDLKQALTNAHFEAIANIAHTLKGSASYFCAEPVQKRAASLESAARLGQALDYAASVADLTQSVEALIHSLQHFTTT